MNDLRRACLISFSEDNDAPQWQSIGDPVMGGRSEGRVATNAGQGCFSGTVRPDNGGGFASAKGQWPKMMRSIAILALAFPAIGLAEAAPEFHLCSPYVKKSEVGEQSDLGWPVFVKLTEVGTTSLAAFTEANTGKEIRIVVGRREFSRATAWVPVPSGNLHGMFNSREVAAGWQRTLATELPASPCGARN